MTSEFRPVIIIGAARSGTNMLRDILTQLPHYGTWDCDEINPIWRHGNLRHASDRFTAELARPEVIQFVRKAFAKIARRQSSENVVEKSCANSIRIPFIQRIFPEARYLFIVRDGRDTVVSAEERWKSSFDLKYTLKKLRYVPVADLPAYAGQFGMNRLQQLFSREKQLRFWGVQLENMDELCGKYSLSEVCALQWKHCVETAHADLKDIAADTVHQVRYEDFVLNPEQELRAILRFLGEDIEEIEIQRLVAGVKASSVGRYKKKLQRGSLEQVKTLIGDSLERFGYSVG